MLCSQRSLLASPLLRRQLLVRNYAVAAQAKAPASKKARPNSATKAVPGSKPSGKIPVNAGKHAPSPTAHKEHAPSTTVAPASKASSSTVTSSSPSTTPKVAPAVEEQPDSTSLTPQQQLEQLEQIQLLQKMYPNTDVWGHFVETLDLQFPYSARLRDRHLYGDWKAYKAQFKANMDNFIKNAFSLWRLAHADAIPSHTYTFPSRTMKYIKWPVQAIKAAWKYSGGWYAPFIGIANKTYREVQTSIAKGDPLTVKKLTNAPYTEEVTNLIRSRQDGLIYKWHGENTSTKIISLRATEAYLEKEEPKFGHRLLIQMLVRFDTTQGLEIFDKYGRKLKLPENASSRKVTEYFVLQKKGWYDSPWVIRQQMYPKKGMPPVAA